MMSKIVIKSLGVVMLFIMKMNVVRKLGYFPGQYGEEICMGFNYFQIPRAQTKFQERAKSVSKW